MDGVVRAPSELGITTGSPPSITEIHEFVVPKSIPIIFPMHLLMHILCQTKIKIPKLLVMRY